jgi:pimeloyl-ACP methyl ester carboxylesterase
VILLHGGSGSWKHWLRTVPALLPHRQVITPDVPGFGDSDLPDPPFSMDALADALQRGLTRILSTEGTCDIVGFSMGASLAVKLAHRLTGRVGHVVLVGFNFVGDDLPRVDGLMSTKDLEGESARIAAYRNNLHVMMFADPERIDATALEIYIADAERRRMPVKALIGSGASVRSEISSLKIGGRVVGICGDGDQMIARVKDRQAAALNALSADAAYCTIAGAGHWVMYEAPSRFNDALLGYLQAK